MSINRECSVSGKRERERKMERINRRRTEAKENMAEARKESAEARRDGKFVEGLRLNMS